MSRTRESHSKIEHQTDNWRHSVGPVPAGEDAPLPTLALGEAGALVHVDKWQSTIVGGGGSQAGTHGDTQDQRQDKQDLYSWVNLAYMSVFLQINVVVTHLFSLNKQQKNSTNYSPET